MISCKECQGEAKHPNVFCSKSCAATYNNREKPKRRLTRQCKHCEATIPSKNTFCGACIKEDRHLRGPRLDESRTIESCMGNGSNRYSQIRQHARKVASQLSDRECMCGVSDGAEVCHIRAISDFPKTATLAEVNHPDNLVFLCPNHHWAYDNTDRFKIVILPNGRRGVQGLGRECWTIMAERILHKWEIEPSAENLSSLQKWARRESNPQSP